ncbi:MAG: hypothetical protein JW795_09355 [Chitinivibrionales bacterium]|nr:hypothetical protein [Chitinivibrionales bacterium]
MTLITWHRKVCLARAGSIAQWAKGAMSHEKKRRGSRHPFASLGETPLPSSAQRCDRNDLRATATRKGTSPTLLVVPLRKGNENQFPCVSLREIKNPASYAR